MKNWGFTTNIELMVPGTNKVYAIERMTNDYAERHPFNVDAFIERVYQKYQQIAAEDPQCAAWARTREELKKQWVMTLGCTRVSGDITIYPNRNGRQEPALMEVWTKAGEYWRRGFHLNDTLPDRVPLMKITRQNDGSWIALAPKELHLLDEPQAVADPLPCPDAAVAAAEPKQEECILPNYNFTHSEEPEPEPAQPCEVESSKTSDFPSYDQSVAAFTETASDQTAEPAIAEPIVTEPDLFQSVTEPEIIQTVRQRNAEARRRRREEREAKQRAYEEQMEREAQEAEDYAREQEQKKIIAAVGAAVITLVLIYFFGLLGPAVFGLLAGGVLKG